MARRAIPRSTHQRRRQKRGNAFVNISTLNPDIVSGLISMLQVDEDYFQDLVWKRPRRRLNWACCSPPAKHRKNLRSLHEAKIWRLVTVEGRGSNACKARFESAQPHALQTDNGTCPTCWSGSIATVPIGFSLSAACHYTDAQWTQSGLKLLLTEPDR